MSARAHPSTLAEVATVRPEEAVALLTDIATTLATWHDAGRGHGSIDPEHVRLATATEPAHLLDWYDGPDDADRIEDDVRQFGLLVEFVAARVDATGRSRAAADRVRMQLDALAAHAGEPDPLRRLAMREIAASLASIRRTPRPSGGPGPKATRNRVVIATAPVVAVVAALGTVGLLSAGGAPSTVAPTTASTPPTSGATTVAVAPATAPAAPHLERDGRHYEAGASGDLLVDLDPDCADGPVAVLLTGQDGDVIAFPRWPDDGDGVVGTTIGRVTGAIGASLEPGCRSLAVIRDVGTPVTITIGARS